MIDIKYIRENLDFVKQNCKVRGSDADVDAIAALDKERREVTQKAEALRSERNRLSKECQTNPAAREQVKAMKEELAALETQEKELEQTQNRETLRICGELITAKTWPCFTSSPAFTFNESSLPG